MPIQFVGLPSADVARIRKTMIDSYGTPVETHPAGEDGWPCRHCLGQTPADRNFLILAHRPFRSRNPYAETGPIFLCEDDCTPAPPSPAVPKILRSPEYLVRGYDSNERIVYGTGRVVPTSRIATYAETVFEDPKIAFVDVRSASNNCFQCRILPG